MTRQNSFKRLVRARMEKAGESYTAARASLLAADEPRAEEKPLVTSNGEIRRRTRSGSTLLTVSYERGRGLRGVGERGDGFAATATKTVAVPVERLYELFVDQSLRERWLPDAAGADQAPVAAQGRRARCLTCTSRPSRCRR